MCAVPSDLASNTPGVTETILLSSTTQLYSVASISSSSNTLNTTPEILTFSLSPTLIVAVAGVIVNALSPTSVCSRESTLVPLPILPY